VIHIRRANPDVFTNHVADCISDGFVGLVGAIQRTEKFDAREFRFKAGYAIRRSIWREFISRMWGGRARMERLATVEKVCEKLRMILEREPDRDEVIAELKLRVRCIKSYLPYIDCVRVRVLSLSDEPCPDLPVVKLIADHSAARPIDILIERESPAEPAKESRAFELAMKGLSRQDRKVFKWMMEGHGPTAIARFLGVCQRTGEDRCSKVKWLARCNKKLAALLGVQPDAGLPPRHGHWPYFHPPPAPLAA
jgi:RNA polymerase sigma factor for flagellar operon FliA